MQHTCLKKHSSSPTHKRTGTVRTLSNTPTCSHHSVMLVQVSHHNPRKTKAHHLATRDRSNSWRAIRKENSSHIKGTSKTQTSTETTRHPGRQGKTHITSETKERPGGLSGRTRSAPASSRSGRTRTVSHRCRPSRGFIQSQHRTLQVLLPQCLPYRFTAYDLPWEEKRERCNS